MKLRILHYLKTDEFEIVSEEGSRLRLSKKEFEAVKASPNGIAMAFSEQTRKKKNK
jgi:hypothetical protein